MTVIVYTIIGEKLTLWNTTKKQAIEFLAGHGVTEEHIFKVEATD